MDNFKCTLGLPTLKTSKLTTLKECNIFGKDSYINSLTSVLGDIRDTIAELRLLIERSCNDGKEIIAYSTCSQRKLKKVLSSLHIDMDIVTDYDGESAGIFEEFNFDGEQSDYYLDASKHIERQLANFGIQFGKGQYDVYDIHYDKNILDVDNVKIDKIFRGGTDIIIGPYGKHPFTIAKHTCVAIELKRADSVIKKGLKYAATEATLELIAANFLSDQLAVVWLTDLSKMSVVFSLKEGQENAISIVAYENLTLNQAASLISSHLNDDCVPIPNSELPTRNRQSFELLRNFKKDRVDNECVGDSIVWEHFYDMLPDTNPFSRERVEIIKQLFTSSDLPIPKVLTIPDMYS